MSDKRVSRTRKDFTCHVASGALANPGDTGAQPILRMRSDQSDTSASGVCLAASYAAPSGWHCKLKGEPALLFFNKARGCECELLVYNNANAQMDAWNTPVRVIRIDMEQRSDLTQQYDVIRAPTLVLLNARNEIIWRQDETMNNVAPLDLEQIETLLAKD